MPKELKKKLNENQEEKEKEQRENEKKKNNTAMDSDSNNDYTDNRIIIKSTIILEITVSMVILLIVSSLLNSWIH